MSIQRYRLLDAVVALALLGSACGGDAEQERAAVTVVATQAQEPASGVAARMRKAGRSVSTVEPDLPPAIEDRTKEQGKAEPEKAQAPVAEQEPGADVGEWQEKSPPARGASRGEGEVPAGEKGKEDFQRAELPRKDAGGEFDCLVHRAVARPLGFAYDHVVYLKNRCQRRMRCTVTTNVNPQPVVEEVEPGKTGTALTFRGSPARVFEATVDCAPAGAVSR